MSRHFHKLIYAAVIVAVCLIVWFAWRSATKVEIKRYPMTGQVISVQLQSHMATVHNDNIPGFMQPMNMDYQVRDGELLSRLKAGDTIHATLATDRQNVWQLEGITISRPK